MLVIHFAGVLYGSASFFTLAGVNYGPRLNVSIARVIQYTIRQVPARFYIVL